MAHPSALFVRSASREPPLRPRLRILLAAPRGFCAGVRRAIAAVEEAIERFGAPVYVRRPIVHNMRVVRALEARGAVFVRELDEVPDGGVVLFSAHGVPRAVGRAAQDRGLMMFDTICPLVRKVHEEVVRHHRSGRHVVLIGHDGHPEVAGTVGQLPAGAISVVGGAEAVAALDLDARRPVAYAVQTTFSVDEAEGAVAALRGRFADLGAPKSSDICYATTNRQAAVKAIAARVDHMLVAGDPLSSNAARLGEVATASGCPSVQMVAGADELDWAALDGARTIGITAAASTPEEAVEELLQALRRRYDIAVEEAEAALETMRFKPLELA
jgi:4-hydroxy-3-methylbut-2-enyl diphosphate reductase